MKKTSLSYFFRQKVRSKNDPEIKLPLENAGEVQKLNYGPPALSEIRESINYLFTFHLPRNIILPFLSLSQTSYYEEVFFRKRLVIDIWNNRLYM